MKKVIASLVSVGLLAAPAIVLAVDAPYQPGVPTPPTWGQVKVMETIDTISDWLFGLLMMVAVIFIIIAGYFFVIAAGDPDKVKRARDFVLYAFIGVLVGFAAKGLVILVDRLVR